jgi:hypothetical protein
MESTAQGVGNNFHELWLAAESGKSDYEAFFAPWWEEPTYTSPVPPDFERTLEEEGIAEIAERSKWAPWTLTDDQLQWRRLTIANECRGKIDQFNRSCGARPARVPHIRPPRVRPGRGGTTQRARRAGDAEAHRRCRHEDGRKPRSPPRADQVREPADREEPREDMDYLIFSDCAAGTGEQGDYQAAYVMPRDEMEIVAAWNGLVDRDIFADNLCRLGYLYNRATIAVEVTAGWCTSVITSLRKDNYPRIYRRRSAGDRRSRKRIEAYGWETTQKTRAEMLDALETALREDDIVCNDPLLLEECRTFSLINGKPQAQGGCHDDRVMAAAGLVYLWLHEPGRQLRPQTPVQPWVPLSSAGGY